MRTSTLLCGLLLVPVAVVAYAACVLAFMWMRWATWLRDVPGPPRGPLVLGQIRTLLRHDLVKVCRAWSETYGGMVRVPAMLGVRNSCAPWLTAQEPRLLITDPVALDHVLRKHAYNYPKVRMARRVLCGIMGDGLISAEGDVHRRQRRAVQPGFSARSVRQLSLVFDAHARELVAHLTQLACDGEALADIYTPINNATLDALGEAAIGIHFRALACVRADTKGGAAPTHPLTRAFNRALEVMTTPSATAVFFDTAMLYMPILERVPIGIASPKVRNASRVLFNVAKDIVDEAKQHQCASGNERPDILASMLRANANLAAASPGGNTPHKRRSLLDRTTLSDRELCAQVSTFIFAGHETTATQITWLLLTLARDPARQAKLRAAVRAKRIELGLHAVPTDDADDAQSRELTIDELDSITYLDWCVRESLRHHGSVHTTSRTVEKPDVIPTSDGRHIPVPKGMLVLVPIAAIARDARLWGANPDDFVPERWSKPLRGSKVFPGVGGISFLMGPRACASSTCAC